MKIKKEERENTHFTENKEWTLNKGGGSKNKVKNSLLNDIRK